jgi:hypothetical protein
MATFFGQGQFLGTLHLAGVGCSWQAARVTNANLSVCPAPQLEADFGEQWRSGSVQGWEEVGGGQQADGPAVGTLDLDAFDSADELEMLGAVPLCFGALHVGMCCAAWAVAAVLR